MTLQCVCNCASGACHLIAVSWPGRARVLVCHSGSWPLLVKARQTDKSVLRGTKSGELRGLLWLQCVWHVCVCGL